MNRVAGPMAHGRQSIAKARRKRKIDSARLFSRQSAGPTGRHAGAACAASGLPAEKATPLHPLITPITTRPRSTAALLGRPSVIGKRSATWVRVHSGHPLWISTSPTGSTHWSTRRRPPAMIATLKRSNLPAWTTSLHKIGSEAGSHRSGELIIVGRRGVVLFRGEQNDASSSFPSTAYAYAVS